MKSVIGRKVTNMRMHTASHLTGVGNLGPVVGLNTKRQGDTDMEIVEGGVVVTINGYSAFVPFGNIQSADLAKE